MEAMICRRYGGPEVLSRKTLPRPSPRRGEVLVAIRAIGVNPKDCMVRKGKFRIVTGNRFPLILGHDVAGEVVERGSGADLPIGAQVFGMINDFAGRAYAEYAAIPCDQLAPIPDGVEIDDAAAAPLASQTALQALRDCAGLEAGQRVLIHGASGGVGTYAVQIAAILGARVTAVCSAGNHPLVRDLGAHETIDYREQDPRELDETFDVVFDVFGNLGFERVRRILEPRATYVNTLPKPVIFRQHLTTYFSAQRSRLVVVRSRRADLTLLGEWMREGRLRSVIERRMSLWDAAEAHRHIETKRTRGKIVLHPHPLPG